jgi:hypothetical protein
MATTKKRSLFALTAVAAAAVAVTLSGCTSVVDGTAVAGDLGPCTHVAAPMLDVPAGNSGEPRMRIPELPGWERDPQIEDTFGGARLALSNTENVAGELPAVVVMVEQVPDGESETIFDDFHSGMVQGLEQEGMPADVARTAKTHCGLPAEMVTFTVTDTAGWTAETLPMTTLVVVTESGGETYLIAVMQTVDPADSEHLREAETILSGFEVLPQDSAAA